MAEKYKAPPAQMKELAKGVYAFLQPNLGFQSNSGLIVGNKWATAFDSQTNKYQIESFISKIKDVTDKPVRFLVNSHFDPDHTFTNHYFPDATAIATKATRDETMRLHPYLRTALPKMVPEPIMSFDGGKMTPQDMTYEGTLTIYDGEHEIRIIDMGAAHTESDAVIYLPNEKIVFCGDIVSFNRGGGIEGVAKGSYHAIEVMEKLSNFDAEQFVPGHGDVILTREQIITDYAMPKIEFLMVMREEARKCFNKGMTYREATDKLDYSKLKKWGDKDKLYANVYGNCARAWSEFRGELPLGRHGGNGKGVELEDTMAKGRRNPDGTYMKIDLGYSRPWQDW
jgi:cyclase